uniref:Macaca fascicularis brain cDNA clone: QorA-13303, similar to human myosin, heavy polypeptide 10, non-muscle (MYH10), mRNA, RefSeq: NM_005964.1 n=1 Tax=Macaca fascicularis TaxID=9541 RepID=I7GK66_MACFA|nr:unnamed protein product [Macaca fascicularis]
MRCLHTSMLYLNPLTDACFKIVRTSQFFARVSQVLGRQKIQRKLFSTLPMLLLHIKEERTIIFLGNLNDSFCKQIQFWNHLEMRRL